MIVNRSQCTASAELAELVDALGSGPSVCKDIRVQVPGSAFNEHYDYSSLQNPLIKQMRKLQQVKYRRQQGQFLLEGTHLLQAAWEQKWALEIVCYTADCAGQISNPMASVAGPRHSVRTS